MTAVISRPCYANRDEVKRAADIKYTARMDAQVDRAIEGASENIDGHLHRRFFPMDETKFFDWPNFQRAYPWRLWLDQNELADVTTTVPVVTSAGTVIAANQIFWGPSNYSPPFTYLELDRSTSASFGGGATPQRSISIKGTFGYYIATDPAGTLAAAVSTTTAATITTSDASVAGPGDALIIDTERMIIQDRAMVQAGTLTLSGTGVTTAVANDVTLAVSGTGSLAIGEVILIDAERMLVVDISGSNYIVKRSWDGTALATHSASAVISAARQLTVIRGALGTTAATHSNAAAVARYRVPRLVKNLCLAEAAHTVLQEIGGYSDPEGPSGAQVSGLGASLPDLWDEAETRYGRKARQRAI